MNSCNTYEGWGGGLGYKIGLNRLVTYIAFSHQTTCNCIMRKKGSPQPLDQHGTLLPKLL